MLAGLAEYSRMKINSDDEEAYYALFGMVLLQWGHIEAELINVLLRLTHPLFGFFDKKGLPPAQPSEVSEGDSTGTYRRWLISRIEPVLSSIR